MLVAAAATFTLVAVVANPETFPVTFPVRDAVTVVAEMFVELSVSVDGL